MKRISREGFHIHSCLKGSKSSLNIRKWMSAFCSIEYNSKTFSSRKEKETNSNGPLSERMFKRAMDRDWCISCSSLGTVGILKGLGVSPATNKYKFCIPADVARRAPAEFSHKDSPLPYFVHSGSMILWVSWKFPSESKWNSNKLYLNRRSPPMCCPTRAAKYESNFLRTTQLSIKTFGSLKICLIFKGFSHPLP